MTVALQETAGVDPLGELLAPLRLEGVFVSWWFAQAPWGLRGDQERNAIVHYVRSGECVVTMPATPEPITLHPGELAIFPSGAPHGLSDRPGRATTPLDLLLPGRLAGRATDLHIDGNGPMTELLCGGLHYDEAAVSPLYRALPDVLVLDREMMAGEPLLVAALAWMVDGARGDAPGARLVALRAFELVFVLALRVALARFGATCPALQALRHPAIGRALVAIQTRFAEPWTLASLAQEAQMSRSAFATTFNRLVGEAPGRHLTGRRMREASRLLKETDVPIGVLAERVGYRSGVGFHLAFRRHFGVPPGQYRRAGTSSTQARTSSGFAGRERTEPNPLK